MLITIRDSKEIWKSPDGQRSIWEITDQDNQVWSTMSRQIAQGIGQSMELTTRVSDKGKTYLIKPPQEGQQAFGGVDGIKSGSGTLGGLEALEIAVEHLTKAVDIFERSVDKLLLSKGLEEIAEAHDMPPAELYENLAGKEIQDDL